jgi:hypothetical protein
MLSTLPAFAQTVNVTILLNTSTVPDTIRSTAFVQMRGNSLPLKNDSSSPVIFTRIAGDYWKATAAFTPHDTVEYEFFVNGNRNKYSGYESPPPRSLIVGDHDTTLPLQYYYGAVIDTSQFWRPFVETDSIEVLFRINMELQEDFQHENRKVGIRGGFAPSNWETTIFMKQEKPHANPGSREYTAGNFWSVVVRFQKPDSSLKLEYKFVQHGSTDSPTSNPQQWEYINEQNCPAPDVKGNRFFTLTKFSGDTTLAYKHWGNNDCPPKLTYDTLFYLTIITNIARTRERSMYSNGDTMSIHHGLAIPNQGMKIMKLNPYGNSPDLLIGTDTVVHISGLGPQKSESLKRYYYLYNVLKNGFINSEHFPFYFYSSPDPYFPKYRYFEYESSIKPQTIIVYDTAKLYPRNDPYFNIARRLNNDVLVTISCDLRPAWYQVAAGDSLVFQSVWPVFKQVIISNKDSIYPLGLSINGFGFDKRGILPWGDTIGNDTLRTMYDDGTHGDRYPNDHIYTRQFQMFKDSAGFNYNLISFRFGVGGYDNETEDFNIYHRAIVSDDADTASISAQFGSVVSWKYDQWNYNEQRPTSIRREAVREVPTTYILYNNFPNPFNPSTTISFSVPSSQSSAGKGPGVNENVTLTIYDLLGRTVATLVNEHLDPGSYSVSWNAQNSPSGLYFYRLHSGDFNQTKRMLLLK